MDPIGGHNRVDINNAIGISQSYYQRQRQDSTETQASSLDVLFLDDRHMLEPVPFVAVTSALSALPTVAVSMHTE